MMQGLGAPELDSLDPFDWDVFWDAEEFTEDWWKLFVNDEGLGEEARELDVARDDEAASSHRGSDAASSLDGFTIFTPASDAPTQPSSASSLSASPAPRRASSCTSSSPNTGPESSSSPISTTPPMTKAEGPFIFCFPANPDAPNGTKKRRGDFDTHKRKKVAGVREVHACHRCKLKKVECDAELVCRGCVKAAGDMALFVCKRKKLLETRSESQDLLAIEHTKGILGRIESCRVPVIGSRKTLYLRLSGGLTAEGPSIRAQVEQYGPTWLTGGTIRGARMKELGDNYHITWVTGSQYMLVEPPDAHALVSLMEGQILSSLRRSIGFANAMDRFVMRYSHSPQDLPLRDLVRDVHHLSCLTQISFCVAYFDDEKDGNGAYSQPSTSATDQVTLVTKTAARALEEKILTSLDALLFSSKGTGPRNGIAVWACLWTLIHKYRLLARLFHALKPSFSRGPKTWTGTPPYDLEMAKHMFHYLVSIYSALFKSTTPLYIDWRLDSNRQLFGQDEELLAAFKALRTEASYFHQSSQWLTSPEDRLLKQMIVDQELAMDPVTVQAKQAAKSWSRPGATFVSKKEKDERSGKTGGMGNAYRRTRRAS